MTREYVITKFDNIKRHINCINILIVFVFVFSLLPTLLSLPFTLSHSIRYADSALFVYFFIWFIYLTLFSICFVADHNTM